MLKDLLLKIKNLNYNNLIANKYQNSNLNKLDILAPIKIKETLNIVQKDYLLKIPNFSNEKEFTSILKSILIPRIVGSDGHFKVQNYITKAMLNLNWTVEHDSFEAETPTMGILKFNNIIAIQNPNAKKYLVLAAHYDSKFLPNREFVGATDSAVPCSMLIHLANTLTERLQKNPSDLGLMLVFFDGEESFADWSPLDSLYGSRHLAIKWNRTGHLKKINMLILLDLIGAENPKFYSFYAQTESEYLKLLNIENQLTCMGILEKNSEKSDQYFQPLTADSYIEDDHTPFLKYGVPAMHLIPVPFPDCWHTQRDNMNILDFKTIQNLNNILHVYVINYLEEYDCINFDLKR